MAYTIAPMVHTDAGAAQQMTEDWASYTKDWAVNPFTSQPWTWDEINALEIGVTLFDNEEKTPACSQVYVEVTYTPAAGIARPLVGGSLAENSLVGKGLAK